MVLIEEIDQYVLSESYVLGAERQESRFRLRVLLVLVETHSEYDQPKADEQFCYRHGWIEFDEATLVEWSAVEISATIDVGGEIDFGNIDSFTVSPSSVELAGRWGKLRVGCRKIAISLG